MHLSTLSQRSFRFLFLLLISDIVFIILELGYRFTDIISGYLFSITADRGYAEIFQYVKEFWIVVLLCHYFVRTRQSIYLLWCTLFGYFLLDDSFSIHEYIGKSASQILAIPKIFTLTPRHMGELFYVMLLGGVFLIALYILYQEINSKDRLITLNLLKLVLFVAFFGVVVDFVHAFFTDGFFYVFFGIIEDGGEMIVMSIIAWYVYFLHDHEDKRLLSTLKKMAND